MNAVKVKWVSYPNPNVKYLNVSVLLWDSIERQKPSDHNLALAAQLQMIPGVCEVLFLPYSIGITKAEVFDWSEIESHAQAIFSDWWDRPLSVLPPRSKFRDDDGETRHSERAV